ncbi:MAG: hypothetical protein NTV70_21835 [Acidobacteria bacterium]|nr:hypothetical protein [Acidobacteriota bacterium]
MPVNKTTRDFEYDYLALSYQIEDLLQKKTSAYSAQEEIEQCHRRLVQLSREILSAEDPRDREYDYLATAYKMQDLLQKKTQAYSLTHDFQRMQQQIETVAAQLQWDARGGSVGNDPGLTSKISQLQSQIEDLRAALV